ncbi:unnamed protein product [marine sediment metagenome]|uniref:Uncharacterized protein n=1 Tax=marine sediment metagenome TaxID=412755 RepID=X1JZC2_9ZZZZ
MKYQVSIEREGNDYLIEVIDTWIGKGIRRTIEIIPPKTWFWERSKYIKEKLQKKLNV